MSNPDFEMSVKNTFVGAVHSPAAIRPLSVYDVDSTNDDERVQALVS